MGFTAVPSGLRIYDGEAEEFYEPQRTTPARRKKRRLKRLRYKMGLYESYKIFILLKNNCTWDIYTQTHMHKYIYIN